MTATTEVCCPLCRRLLILQNNGRMPKHHHDQPERAAELGKRHNPIECRGAHLTMQELARVAMDQHPGGA
jgi:hypothetical protein